MRDLLRIVFDALLDRPGPKARERVEGRRVSVYEIGMAKNRYGPAQRRPLQRHDPVHPGGRGEPAETPVHGAAGPKARQTPPGIRAGRIPRPGLGG